jgi:hypothetical protein
MEEWTAEMLVVEYQRFRWGAPKRTTGSVEVEKMESVVEEHGPERVLAALPTLAKIMARKWPKGMTFGAAMVYVDEAFRELDRQLGTVLAHATERERRGQATPAKSAAQEFEELSPTDRDKYLSLAKSVHAGHCGHESLLRGVAVTLWRRAQVTG